ncbi:MAG: hypothetical protein QG582_923 [Candidatus Thermoplasmatota archaeon]|nr:hypothetical protein [Candidatus Thermoplasmatota archaeon]
MSGTPRVCDQAQLALLDAMVFFAISAVICATLMAHAATQLTGPDEAVPSPSEADELLAAFLGSSIGREFVIQSLEVEVTGYERFSDVLFMVSAMLLDGEDLGSFAEVMSYCHDVLDGLCEPWSSMLRLSSAEDGSLRTLAEVGEQPAAGVDTCASSQSLGASDGTGLVVTLVLSPTLLLHGVGV